MTTIAKPKAGDGVPPPQDFEALTKAIHDVFHDLSPSYQRAARYLTQNPNDVAFQSVTEIAKGSGVHASSLVRFAQLLGFNGFKQLQMVYQTRLSTAAPGFAARVDALRSELQLHSRDGMRGYLADLAARDIASLQQLLVNTGESDLDAAVDLLANADTIYLAGQLRSAPIATFLRYVLTMLRRRVVLLDANGGLATEMAKVMVPGDLLLAISFRYYAKEVVRICDAAGARGVPIVAITDGSLSPLAKFADVLFAIPEDDYSFSRSLAAPMCLSQALMIALASRLQPAGTDEPRIPIVTDPDGTDHA